jgi:hypothetical protein
LHFALYHSLLKFNKYFPQKWNKHMNEMRLPEAFSSSSLGLGAPKRYFPVKNIRRVSNLVFFFLFLLGAAAVFLYGIYDTSTAIQAHGVAVVEDHLVTPTIIAGVLFLLGVWAGWSAHADWNRGAALYEKGFVVRDRHGMQPWRWEEIVSLTSAVTRHYTNGIYTGTTHVYTLYNQQNKRLVLNDALGKVEELAKAIEEGCFPYLYERLALQYNSGQPLTFGPVAISKTAIQVGKKVYPWNEVKEVSLNQGFIKVSKTDGGWFSGANAAASTIPNLHVLLSIINQVVGVKTGK